jgi:peptidoglycan/xylan/chitin deacetylase (PgdA/CDA1 family)
MNLFQFSIKTKGLKNFLKRFFLIFSRFGFTGNKYIRYLRGFQELQERFCFKTSFPVTASVLDKNKKELSGFQSAFRFLVHGFLHVDYTALAQENIRRHIAQAKKAFPVTESGGSLGFRAPYLRYNDKLRDVLAEENFLFDSSRTIFLKDFGMHIDEKDWEIISSLYSPSDFRDSLSLPYYDGSLIELPVILPDDEIIIDRLDEKSPQNILKMFRTVGENIFSLQEMYVMQLHPERILFMNGPLSQFLEILSEKNIWITDLPTLAEWHQKASRSSYSIDPEKKIIRYTPIENRPVKGRKIDFRIEKNAIHYRSEKIPAVFLSENSDPLFLQRLNSDGFFVLQGEGYSQMCSFTAGELGGFSASAYRKIYHDILNNEAPMIYQTRWPEGKQGAFCLSGDIDALSLGDFFRRFIHFQENR